MALVNNFEKLSTKEVEKPQIPKTRDSNKGTCETILFSKYVYRNAFHAAIKAIECIDKTP